VANRLLNTKAQRRPDAADIDTEDLETGPKVLGTRDSGLQIWDPVLQIWDPGHQTWDQLSLISDM